MALHSMTAAERRAPQNRKSSFLITGPYGIGKTSLLRTLPPELTYAVDIEGGLRSVDSWDDAGPSINITNYRDFQDLTALIAGPDPAAANGDFCSFGHCEHVRGLYAGTPVEENAKRPIIFVDSITVLTRYAMQYAQQQPAAFSEKTGNPDTRAAYGLLGRMVVSSLQHLQKAPGKTIIFACLLEKVTDDFGRTEWVPQMEGSKIGRSLPGIVDEVLTMQSFRRGDDDVYVLDDKSEERLFVTKSINPYSLPAKDRDGRLNPMEAPDLGAILRKINAIT